MSSKKQKIIPLNNEGLKDADIEKYPEDPSKFNLKTFLNDLQINIISKNSEEMVFDMIGVEPPLANTLRRILLSEIPTMAIDTVIIHQNTSIIPDEVLSHRLGLIPILADAEDFQYKRNNDDFNENNSIKFKLQVKCYTNDKGEVVNDEIKSDKLIYVPIGKQGEKYKGTMKIKPVYNDIVINKLRPGQEIDCELICIKGIGRTHAKWSPVCTAYYRLLNSINIPNEINGEAAQNFAKLCPMSVFNIDKKGKLFVENNRKCTTCRECIRHDKYKGMIELGKISDHYEFHIESVGIYEPEEIFFRALKVLKNKCEIWTGILDDKIEEQKLANNKNDKDNKGDKMEIEK